MRDVLPGTDAALGYAAGPGGLRVGLPVGPITQGAVYDAFPFDNRVVRLTVTGAELEQMLTSQLRRPRFRSRSLGVSGLQVVVDCVNEQLEVEVRRPTGEPLGATDRLVVATTDFMAARLGSDARDPEAGRSRVPPGTYSDAPLVREVAARWISRAGRHAARWAIRGSRASAMAAHRAGHDRLSDALTSLRLEAELKLCPTHKAVNVGQLFRAASSSKAELKLCPTHKLAM